ncbi:MAG: type VII secretion integral membrane protein EccD [Nocardia sp.]|nr:type VII secretion integral membrane protein EccD [Nocardia sp.]
MTETFSSGGGGSAAPELCRVSVIGGNTQLDVGLPATAPVATYISDLVELIESRTVDLTEHEEGTPARVQHWTLAKIGRPAIPPHQSLTDAEVFDGDLLVLRSVTTSEAPALFDDVIDAVSRLAAQTSYGWSAVAARWVGLATALAGVLLAIAVLVLHKGTGIWTGFLPLGTGIVAAGAAVILARRYPEESLTAVLVSLYATVLLGAGAGLLVPSDPGAPHLVIAAVTTVVVSLILHSITRLGALIAAGVVTLAAIVAVAAVVRMVWAVDISRIAVGVMISGLILITMAPRIAVAAARLPVPPVPTAGAAIDPADHELRPTIADIGVIGATALPSAAGLEFRARVATLYQSGVVIGATVAAAFGAIVAADPLGRPGWAGLALAAVVAAVLSLRGRAYADLVQAATLRLGGAVTAFAVAAGVTVPHHDWHPIVAGLLLLVAAVAVVAGVIGPHTDISPIWRRTIEIIEYLLIVLIVPLSLWLMDIYSAARNI